MLYSNSHTRLSLLFVFFLVVSLLAAGAAWGENTSSSIDELDISDPFLLGDPVNLEYNYGGGIACGEDTCRMEGSYELINNQRDVLSYSYNMDLGITPPTVTDLTYNPYSELFSESYKNIGFANGMFLKVSCYSSQDTPMTDPYAVWDGDYYSPSGDYLGEAFHYSYYSAICFSLPVGTSENKFIVQIDYPVYTILSQSSGMIDFVPPVSGGKFFNTSGPHFLYHKAGVLYRIDEDGTLLDPAGIALPFSAADAAFDGTNYLLTTNGRGVRMAQDGTILDPTGFDTCATCGSSVVFNGTNYLVSNGEMAARVAPDGTVLDPGGFPIDLFNKTSSLYFTGTDYLFTAKMNNGLDLYGGRMTLDHTIIDPGGFLIRSAQTNKHFDAKVAYNDNSFFSVWFDNRKDVFLYGRYRCNNQKSSIYGTQITPVGNVLDPDGLHLHTAENFLHDVILAANNTHNLVSYYYTPFIEFCEPGPKPWEDDWTSKLITPDGTIEQVINNGSNYIFYRLAAASDGFNWLQVYTKAYAGETYYSLKGQILGLDAFEILPEAEMGYDSPLSLIFNGTDYLMLYGDDYPVVLHGMRIATDGTILDPAGFLVTNEFSYDYREVATNAEDILIALRDCYLRVAADGTVLDPVCIPWSEASTDHQLAFGKNFYLRIWYSDILESYCATWIDQDGAILNPDPIVLDASVEEIRDLASDDAGTFLLISDYEGWTIQEPLALGEACQADDECIFGYCVDGVCCQSECNGGATDDCQACSVTAGSTQDGFCEPVADQTVCDDDLFCTVNDQCAGGLCLGEQNVCDDNVACTDDSCDENADACTNTTNDANCDNGLWCDGAETCDAISDCQPGTAPDCDDGLFCTGVESCDEAGDNCVSPGNPCSEDETCDEDENICVEDPCWCGIQSAGNGALAPYLLLVGLGLLATKVKQRRRKCR